MKRKSEQLSNTQQVGSQTFFNIRGVSSSNLTSEVSKVQVDVSAGEGAKSDWLSLLQKRLLSDKTFRDTRDQVLFDSSGRFSSSPDESLSYHSTFLCTHQTLHQQYNNNPLLHCSNHTEDEAEVLEIAYENRFVIFDDNGDVVSDPDPDEYSNLVETCDLYEEDIDHHTNNHHIDAEASSSGQFFGDSIPASLTWWGVNVDLYLMEEIRRERQRRRRKTAGTSVSVSQTVTTGTLGSREEKGDIGRDVSMRQHPDENQGGTVSGTSYERYQQDCIGDGDGDGDVSLSITETETERGRHWRTAGSNNNNNNNQSDHQRQPFLPQRTAYRPAKETETGIATGSGGTSHRIRGGDGGSNGGGGDGGSNVGHRDYGGWGSNDTWGLHDGGGGGREMESGSGSGFKNRSRSRSRSSGGSRCNRHYDDNDNVSTMSRSQQQQHQQQHPVGYEDTDRYRSDYHHHNHRSEPIRGSRQRLRQRLPSPSPSSHQIQYTTRYDDDTRNAHGPYLSSSPSNNPKPLHHTTTTTTATTTASTTWNHNAQPQPPPSSSTAESHWTADQRPSPASETTTLTLSQSQYRSHVSQDIRRTVEEKYSMHPYNRYFFIPEESVSGVIGRGGGVVQDLRKEFRVGINVDKDAVRVNRGDDNHNEYDNDLFQRRVIVFGADDSALEAVHIRILEISEQIILDHNSRGHERGGHHHPSRPPHNTLSHRQPPRPMSDHGFQQPPPRHPREMGGRGTGYHHQHHHPRDHFHGEVQGQGQGPYRGESGVHKRPTY
eukprot:gene7133-14511_t